MEGQKNGGLLPTAARAIAEGRQGVVCAMGLERRKRGIPGYRALEKHPRLRFLPRCRRDHPGVVGDPRVGRAEGERLGDRGRYLVDPACGEQGPGIRVVPIDVLPPLEGNRGSADRQVDASFMIGWKRMSWRS